MAAGAVKLCSNRQIEKWNVDTVLSLHLRKKPFEDARLGIGAFLFVRQPLRSIIKRGF